MIRYKSLFTALLQAAAVALVLGLAFWAMMNWVDQGRVRMFAWVLPGTALSLVAIYAYFFLGWLKGKDEVIVAESKLVAEIFAAVAISGFAVVFYKFGLDIDRSNVAARSGHLQQSRTDIDRHFGCTTPRPGLLCPQVTYHLAGADTALLAGNEAELQQHVAKVRHWLLTSRRQMQATKLSEDLGAVIVEDALVESWAVIFYAVLMAFAILATSRKIALARHDHRAKIISVAERKARAEAEASERARKPPASPPLPTALRVTALVLFAYAVLSPGASADRTQGPPP